MDDRPNDDSPLRGTLIPSGVTPTVVGAGPAPFPGEDAFPILAGFTILRKLGEGGMGAVYLAEDTKLGRRIAIKTMRRELAVNRLDRDRFLREARAAATVENDHLVPIWTVGEAGDGTPFIAMPFLQGESLADRLKREPVASLEALRKIGSEVASGLAAAHAAGLIHRDIKPPNVWLEGNPASNRLDEQVRRCKILDFGLARPVEDGVDQLTASGAILGTPAYMAPEQARGERVDARADLFSLGVMLYRMATGRQPFDGPTPMAVLIALTTDTPPSARAAAPALPGDVADIIDRMMSKDPDVRPASAAEVAAVLQGGARTHQRPRANGSMWLAVAAAACVVSAIGVWLATRGNGSPAVDEATGKQELPPKPPEPKPDITPPSIAPKTTPAPTEADRKAARFVLSMDGSVQVEAGQDQIRDAAKLPKEPFRLTEVFLTVPVKESSLDVFSECRDITILYIAGTQITNTGLNRFANCTNLASLDLPGTKVDDDGIPAITRFKKLKDLSIGSTGITPKGAREIAKALPLCRIQYGSTFEPATQDDRIVAEFVLASGGRVGLNFAEKASADAKLPKEPFRLTSVDLTGSAAATNAETDRFKACKSLERLVLADTAIGDAGTAPLKECAKLVSLDLRKTKVSEKAASDLFRSLPECEIQWNGGSFRPKR